MRKITPAYLVASFLLHNTWLSKHINDSSYLKILFKGYMGQKLNLEAPKTYNEKLQWMKIHYFDENYTSMVDKYEAKKIIGELIGEEYIIPTLGVWDSYDDINFSDLPDQFVLKCTHDSGGVYVCHDKSKIDHRKVRKQLESSLNKNFYWECREWPYKNIKPRIIAEKYMEDHKMGQLIDYKFFTFNGEPKYMFIASDRQKAGEETKFDFFDMDFNYLQIKNGHPNSDITPIKPENFELMKELAIKLSEGLPHVRVDFYEVDSKVYFGEMTFFHWSGLTPFIPEEWDYKLGEVFSLPKRNK